MVFGYSSEWMKDMIPKPWFSECLELQLEYSPRDTPPVPTAWPGSYSGRFPIALTVSCWPNPVVERKHHCFPHWVTGWCHLTPTGLQTRLKGQTLQKQGSDATLITIPRCLSSAFSCHLLVYLPEGLGHFRSLPACRVELLKGALTRPKNNASVSWKGSTSHWSRDSIFSCHPKGLLGAVSSCESNVKYICIYIYTYTYIHKYEDGRRGERNEMLKSTGEM